MKPAVSGLESEFPGQVKCTNEDATQPSAVEEVKSLGFRSHGLVIRSAAGEVLWKQPDHEVKIEDARAALRDLLGSS